MLTRFTSHLAEIPVPWKCFLPHLAESRGLGRWPDLTTTNAPVSSLVRIPLAVGNSAGANQNSAISAGGENSDSPWPSMADTADRPVFAGPEFCPRTTFCRRHSRQRHAVAGQLCSQGIQSSVHLRVTLILQCLQRQVNGGSWRDTHSFYRTTCPCIPASNWYSDSIFRSDSEVGDTENFTRSPVPHGVHEVVGGSKSCHHLGSTMAMLVNDHGHPTVKGPRSQPFGLHGDRTILLQHTEADRHGNLGDPTTRKSRNLRQ